MVSVIVVAGAASPSLQPSAGRGRPVAAAESIRVVKVNVNEGGRESTGVVIAIQSAIPTVPTVPTSTDAVAQGAGGGERCLAARERERASEIANGGGGGSDESSKTSNTSEFYIRFYSVVAADAGATTAQKYFTEEEKRQLLYLRSRA